jgi:heme-degrading monooxygenase HmoA
MLRGPPVRVLTIYQLGKKRTQAQETKQMFIAMNRFRVKKGSEDAFEKVWVGRDSYLDRIPGFLEFHLLKGPEAEDHTLYSSHTVWLSKRAFEAWTKAGRPPGPNSRPSSSFSSI